MKSNPVRTPSLVWRPAVLLLVLLVGPPPARALQGDEQQPMYIEADDVEVRESESVSIYVGNVQVDQGTIRLRADHVTVHHREDRRPKFMIALGQPATYRQQLDGDEGEVEAMARRMEFDVEADLLTLIDEAVLIQGRDRLASDRIQYDRNRAHFRAGGSGRVRITITPEPQPQTAPRP